MLFFFFKQKTAYEMRISDWSSDVCSSDLLVDQRLELVPQGRKTIAYEEIKKRFQHFRLPLDWDKVDRIGAIRNALEHFYHAGDPSNVQEAVAAAATVIRHLLDLHGLDPVGSSASE